MITLFEDYTKPAFLCVDELFHELVINGKYSDLWSHKGNYDIIAFKDFVYKIICSQLIEFDCLGLAKAGGWDNTYIKCVNTSHKGIVKAICWDQMMNNNDFYFGLSVDDNSIFNYSHPYHSVNGKTIIKILSPLQEDLKKMLDEINKEKRFNQFDL